MLMLNPSLFHVERDNERASILAQTVPATPSLYDASATDGGGRFTVARLNGQWRQRIADAVRAEASGFVSRWQSKNMSLRQEYRSGDATPLRTIDDQSDTRETSLKLGGKLTALFGGNEAIPGSEHNLVAGAEVESVKRRRIAHPAPERRRRC